jgi:hypothetical protein
MNIVSVGLMITTTVNLTTFNPHCCRQKMDLLDFSLKRQGKLERKTGTTILRENRGSNRTIPMVMMSYGQGQQLQQG